MGKASALNVAELSRDENLEFLDQLWESQGQDPEALPLTSSQREELDRRFDEFEDEGPTGLSWDNLLGSVEQRDDAGDLEIINAHSAELNEEAADVLEYQIIL